MINLLSIFTLSLLMALPQIGWSMTTSDIDYRRPGRHRQIVCRTSAGRYQRFTARARGPRGSGVRRRAVRKCIHKVRNNVFRPRRVQRLVRQCRDNVNCRRVRRGGRH